MNNNGYLVEYSNRHGSGDCFSCGVNLDYNDFWFKVTFFDEKMVYVIDYKIFCPLCFDFNEVFFSG